MKKNFLRGCIVLFSLIAAFLICEKVFMLKSEDGIEQMKSYYLQKENTVDVLLIGSSHIYCNVNTGTLWDTFGMSAFDLGGAEQPYWNSYYFIKEALKTQRPKVIVMSVTIPGIRFDDYQSEAWLMTNLYGMHWNTNRIENNKVSTLPESFWRLLFPMNTIHSRYTDLTRDDFVDKNYDIAYKGFDLRSTVTPYERPDITGVTEMTPMTEKQEIYLRKIIELTKKENIPLLLVSVPYVVTEDAQKIYNYEFDVAAQEGIECIDFNKCYDLMGLDFSTDMAEELHLNISGSAKFTKCLGQYLVDRYGIPDHRGDSNYSSWEKNALIERQEINAAQIPLMDDFSEYLDVVNNDNYITIIDFEGMEATVCDSVLVKLSEMGVDTGSIENGYVSVNCGGKTIFASNNEEFSAFVDEGIDKILVKRTSENDRSSTLFYVNTDAIRNPMGSVFVIVYDRVLDRIVGYTSYNANDNSIIKFN